MQVQSQVRLTPTARQSVLLAGRSHVTASPEDAILTWVANAAVSARGGEAELLILAEKAVGDGGDEPRAGGTERVPDRQRAAMDVELLERDRAYLAVTV